jgi:hypothetical protein
MEGQVTHSPGRIGYASGKLPYNRLLGDVTTHLDIGQLPVCGQFGSYLPSPQLTPNL